MQFGLREMMFTSLLLGLVAGTYATIVEPHAQVRKQQLAEMRVMDNTLARIGDSAGEFAALARHVDQEQQAAALFDSRLPRDGDVQKSIDEVMQAAAANSLEVGDVVRQKCENINAIQAQPVKMQVTGDFNGFYSFLLQLESMPHVTRITQVNLLSADGHDGQIQADLTLKMYFGGQKSAARAD